MMYDHLKLDLEAQEEIWATIDDELTYYPEVQLSPAGRETLARNLMERIVLALTTDKE